VCFQLPDYSISLDLFLLKGKRCLDTVALVLSDDDVEPANFQMNKCIRKSLDVFLGDIVRIFSCSDCPDCTRVAILPSTDTVEGLSGDLFDTFLKPYFPWTSRPLHKLDTFTVSAGIRNVEFQITECEPGEDCSVTFSTEIHTEGKPLECKDDDKADIGDHDNRLRWAEPPRSASPLTSSLTLSQHVES
jgi:transitional endoplasmic reticulum ATPase